MTIAKLVAGRACGMRRQINRADLVTAVRHKRNGQRPQPLLKLFIDERKALLAVGLLLAALGLAWFARSALAPAGQILWLRGRWGALTFALGVGLWAAAAFHG